MADENTVVSSDTEDDNRTKITSFETSTTYANAVDAYNDARVTSTGEITGGDQLNFFERIKSFFKSNWLTMLITFIVTFITVRFMGQPTKSSSVGGFSLWKN